MPQIINGCGTWYYGKRNVVKREGVCEACGGYSALTSYDTRLFVVFIMIPIIPLGRKRIIDECSSCRRHRAMRMSDWESARQRIAEASEAYRQSPTDADRAKDALQLAVGHRDLDAYNSLAPLIEQHLAFDADMICLLAACSHLFSRTEEEEHYLRRALDVKDTADIREMVADCLLRQGRAEEAAQYLQHIVHDGIPDRVDLLYHLAQVFQANGEHERALEVFDQCEIIAPSLGQDGTFRSLREASEKKRGTHIAVKPAKVVKRIQQSAARRRLAKTVPVVLALAALAYVTVAWVQGMRRQVWLANGLTRPYTARLNDTTYTLEPMSVVSIRLEEGDIRVELVDPPLPVEPETVRIETAFLTRPFANRTFVLNPDGAAILQRTRVYYSAGSGANAAPEPEYSFAAGRVLHRFDDVDCPFEEFPETVSVSSGSWGASRDGLSLVKHDDDLAAFLLPAVLMDQLGKDASARVAQRELLMDPEQGEFLGLLIKTMNRDDLVVFLRQGLDKRPLLIDWHRTYQSTMEALGRQEEVEQEYDAMLAQSPEDRDLMYLAGRAARDPEKYLRLCRQAVAGDSPSPRALQSLCSHFLGEGDFPQAVEYAERAQALLPDDPAVTQLWKQSLLANGETQRSLESLRALEAAPIPQCLWAFSEEAYVHTILGQESERRAVLDRLRTRVQDWSSAFIDEQIREAEATCQYCRGNVRPAAEMLQQSQDPENRFIACLIREDLAGAEQEMGQMDPSARAHLVVYLAAAGGGQTELAERQVAAAIELLAQGDHDEQVFARALQDGSQVTTEELLRLQTSVHEKPVLLAAVGLRDPGKRDACFALAAKLNFDRRFPHLLLKRVLESPAP